MQIIKGDGHGLRYRNPVPHLGDMMPKESTNWVKRLKGKVKEHSPAGKLYRQLGDKGTEQVYAERQRAQRLKKRVGALGKSETTAQKDRNTYVSTTSTGPLPVKDWLKREGRSASQSSIMAYGIYEKGFKGR